MSDWGKNGNDSKLILGRARVNLYATVAQQMVTGGLYNGHRIGKRYGENTAKTSIEFVHNEMVPINNRKLGELAESGPMRMTAFVVSISSTDQ